MHKPSFRLFTLLLCLVVCGTQFAFAAGPETHSPALSAVHDQVLKRGVGHGVKLIRPDNSEIKGRIVAIREDSVDLQTKGSTEVSNVAFTDVAKVRGPGLSTGAKIGIGVGIGVVVCVSIAAIVISHQLNKAIGF